MAIFLGAPKEYTNSVYITNGASLKSHEDYPSEIVTLGLWFALKGVSNRTFYHHVRRDYRILFPNLPSRTSLFRPFNINQPWDGSTFQIIVDQVAGQTVIFANIGFKKKDWKSEHLRICQRGEWNARMIIETALSVLTLVCHLNQVMHRR